MNEKITKHTPRGSIAQVAYWAIQRELQMRKMNCMTFCPKCNFELTSQNNAIEHENGLVFHTCKNCGAGSRWNYDAPVPLNVT